MQTTFHYYNNNSLLIVNAKGEIRILYTPFRVLCTKELQSIPLLTWVYVDEVCSTERDELIYVIYGQPYSYKSFRLKINF